MMEEFSVVMVWGKQGLVSKGVWGGGNRSEEGVKYALL